MNLKPDSVLIGFDYGTKKMGVAIAQCITKTATPLNVLKIKNEKPNWEQLDQIVSDYRPVLAIIGYPGKINKQTSLLADKIEKFGSAIEKHYKLSNKDSTTDSKFSIIPNDLLEMKKILTQI